MGFLLCECMELLVPNHTQIPNVFLENIHDLSGAAVQVMCAICRKTIGWHKETDYISRSKIKEMTGLSIAAISTALKELIKKGYIITENTKGKTLKITVNFKTMPVSGKVTMPNSGRGMPDSDKVTMPVSGNTKERRKETIQKKNIPFIPLAKKLYALHLEIDEKLALKKDKFIADSAVAFRILIQQDGREYELVNEMIDWCKQDEFWKTVIRSGGGFRKNFPTMYPQFIAIAEKDRAELEKQGFKFGD